LWLARSSTSEDAVSVELRFVVDTGQGLTTKDQVATIWGSMPIPSDPLETLPRDLKITDPFQAIGIASLPLKTRVEGRRPRNIDGRYRHSSRAP
jgi:hypothetical protein